jgi:hypothetical protein
MTNAHASMLAFSQTLRSKHIRPLLLIRAELHP